MMMLEKIYLMLQKSYTVDFMSFNNEEKIMFLFSNEKWLEYVPKPVYKFKKNVEIVYTVNSSSFLIYVHQL